MYVYRISTNYNEKQQSLVPIIYDLQNMKAL